MKNNQLPTEVQIARALQTRRENWKKTLDALPMPGAGEVSFPYGSMEAAIADGFELLKNGEKEDGKAVAFRLLVKGFKTRAWRKLAEKNRDSRDAIAEQAAKKEEQN
jgi:prophage DNA circulation protein